MAEEKQDKIIERIKSILSIFREQKVDGKLVVEFNLKSGGVTNGLISQHVVVQ